MKYEKRFKEIMDCFKIKRQQIYYVGGFVLMGYWLDFKDWVVKKFNKA